MRPQAFQHGEIRDENDNIIQNGAYGKLSAFVNAQNDGILDYLMNNLETLNNAVLGNYLIFPSQADFPETGDASKVYIDNGTGKPYKWNGTGYTELDQQALQITAHNVSLLAAEAKAAASAAKTSETNAAGSASAALVSQKASADLQAKAKTSEINAKASENNSKSSENLAKAWAMSESSPDGVDGNKSAKTWAMSAISAEANAKQSEINANSYKNAAASSATASANSASASSASEINSANSAKASASSAAAAKASEANAKASADRANSSLETLLGSQVNADWAITDNTNKAFIKNKPDLTVYATKEELETECVDKINQLNTALKNGFTTASLTVSGETSVPTPATTNKSKTIANTEFVHGVVSDLVNGAPNALDTLQELASALGNDPNFSTTILNKIGEKESKTDAQIEHEKLQNAINLCLKGKAVLRGGTSDNPETVTIPLEAGMFPVYGFPDGSFKEQPTYQYGIVVNFQGTSGAFLSLYSLNYFFNETEGLYYRIGFQGKGWNTTWHKVANTANVKKQISAALTNYAKLNEVFPITDTGRKIVETEGLTDLNDIKCLSYPSWLCRLSATIPTLSNCPAKTAFFLYNLRSGFSSDKETLPNLTGYYYYILQILIDINGNVWRRCAFNRSTPDFSFTEWVKVATTDDLSSYYTKTEVDNKIPTKTSQLTNDSNFAVISNGHLVINGSELWIE